MNKFFLILSLLFPTRLFAQTLTLPNPVKADSLVGVVVIALDSILPLLFVISILVFIYYGFLFVTSAGVPDKISKAKTGLIWAFVGAALIVGAKALSTAFLAQLKIL